MIAAVVSAKLLELVDGLLQLLLFVEFCEFWLFDVLFCILLVIDLLVVLLDAKSLLLTEILGSVGIILLLWLFECELRRCVLSAPGVWPIGFCVSTYYLVRQILYNYRKYHNYYYLSYKTRTNRFWKL